MESPATGGHFQPFLPQTPHRMAFFKLVWVASALQGMLPGTLSDSVANIHPSPSITSP
jgi:hypothetical protein